MYAMRTLRNFKTNQCCYLTPLAKSGYIAVAGGEKNRYLPGKQYSGRHVGGLDFGERDPFDEGFDRDV